MKKSLLINIFGGPGCGKTTMAWELATEFKKLGISVEYVPEYGKELFYEGRIDLLDGSYKNEMDMLEEKMRRISRYNGKVDIIICDSPFIQSILYAKLKGEELNSLELRALALDNEFNSQNFFLERTFEYEQEGRVQLPKESILLDARIQGYLASHKIPFERIYPSSMMNSSGRVVFDIAKEILK